MSLLSSSDDNSHKRLISLLSFAALVSILILNACEINIQEHITYIFAGLCGYNTILTVIEKFKK